jgi:hypothetical protein
LSTRNRTWPELGSNQGRRRGKPATNCLSYDTALDLAYLMMFQIRTENQATGFSFHMPQLTLYPSTLPLTVRRQIINAYKEEKAF